MNGMTREKLLEFVFEQYGTTPDYAFDDATTAVLRHPCGKWYGLVFRVPSQVFGIEGDRTDALNVKCPPELTDFLSHSKGFAPAYHMNKRHWLSVILDGSIDPDQVKFLIDQSYSAVTPRNKVAKERKP